MERSGCTEQHGGFSTEELKALSTIKEIVDSGGNAEVKKNNGVMTVYEVSKKKRAS